MAYLRCTGTPGGSLKLRTAQGDIASFETNLAASLQSVLVNVVATGGNGTPDNPNPIVGYSSANITRCGVNLMHVDSRVSQTTAQVIYTSDDNYIELNGTKYGGTYADLSTLTITLPAGTYYLKAFEISGTATNAPSITAYDGSDLTSNILNNERTLTLNAPITFRFRFALWTDNAVYTNYKVGIVISTASISEYSEYTGNTYTVNFGQTVYGGVLDVTRGKLTNTFNDNLLDLGSLNWVKELTGGHYHYYSSVISGAKGYGFSEMPNILCTDYPTVTRNTLYNANLGISFDTDVRAYIYNPDYDNESTTGADVKTALSGVMCAYELATPFDIDLTPVQVEQLLGKNNVWHDANGDTEVKFLEVVRS